MTRSSSPLQSRLRRLVQWIGGAVLLTVMVAGVGAAEQVIALEERLSEARNSLQVREYTETIRRSTDLLAQINSSPLEQAARKPLLAETFLVRAQAYYFNNDIERAKSDFKQMLSANPEQRFDTTIPGLLAALAEARRTVVGTLRLRVTPVDAEVRIDGIKIDDPGAPLALAAGNYAIAASRRSYEAKQQQVYVVAGEVTDLEVPLTRMSSTAIVVTAPPGVDVALGDGLRGRTPDGPAPLDYQPALQAIGVGLNGASAPLELTDISAGNYVLQFRKPCFVGRELSFPATELKDYVLPPVKLERAVGTIRLAGDTGDVVLDGESKGQVRTLADICEGRHAVEVLSSTGRYVEVVDVTTDSDITVTATVRPAIALLGVTGLPDTYRGPDQRQQLSQAFAGTSLTVFAPAPELATNALRREQLSEGWLSTPPTGFTPAARHDVSLRLAELLRVQALAEIHVPDVGDSSTVELSVLAAGSSRADRVLIPLGDPPTTDALLKSLDDAPPMFSHAVGLELADVYTGADEPAVAVVVVESGSPAAAAGINPGDLLTRANGQAITAAADFLSLLSTTKEGEAVALDLADRSDAVTTPKRASLKVVARPAVIAFDDETLYPNRLILEYRRRLPQAAPGLEQAVLHLNLGVALMKVGSWSDAEAELRSATLDGTNGVSTGTVQFLLAQCYRQLGRPVEMAAALDLAAKAAGAQLTVNGPLISELVKKERQAR